MIVLKGCQVPSSAVRPLIAGTVLYGLLCLAFLTGIPDPSFVPDRLATPLAAIGISVIGPAVVFTDGFEGWRWFGGTIIIVLTFLRLACRLWHRFPHEEWFAIPLVAAALTWVASGWFLATMLTA